MFAGFALFGAGSAAVIASHKASPAVFGLDLIMYISVAISTFSGHFVTVLNFAFRINGAGIATEGITAVIRAGFRSIGFSSGGTGIGIAGIFELTGTRDILAANRIFVVALSAGAERGKFAFNETVGADTAGKENRIPRTVRSRVRDFIAFTIREGISGTIRTAVKFKFIAVPVGKEVNFGKLHRLWPVGCVNVKREGRG